MRTPQNCKNNKVTRLQFSHYNFQATFHSEVCRRLREVRWERHQEALEEQAIQLQFGDQFFGEYKEFWFEGEDYPGFPSITKVILTEEETEE